MKGPRVQKLTMAAKGQSQSLQAEYTMLVVRNIPGGETVDHLQTMWPADGLGWNYLHLAYSVAKFRSMGYAFISFTDHQRAVEFTNRWHQRFLPGHASHRPLSVSVATVQSVAESLTSIKWELLLQLVRVGMEPVLLAQGQRVDTRFAYLALSRRLPTGLASECVKAMKATRDLALSKPGLACLSGGLTGEHLKTVDGFAPSKPRFACFPEGLTGKPIQPVKTLDDTDVPVDGVPWPLHLAVLSL
eukprot:CAMPEP_0171092824 /NCGR_PEP_ID=MMETSP0766_2-20121228/37574_1 /TAXON_ID=439317 /ORGANISM="Gambierdiscus australes, Strain CAWD 149" /LENGTH=244 /DNA_ID=CAMNT_0011551135 /DNA_START=42 /DNA_END=776 /DNA_ORIENTATION=+